MKKALIYAGKCVSYFLKPKLIGTITCALLLIIPIHQSSEKGMNGLGEIIVKVISKPEKISNFENGYITVRNNEGNYANVLNDFGGETYGGITRNFDPGWAGWAAIDSTKKHEYDIFIKKHPGSKTKLVWWKLKSNQAVPEAELHVKKYYKDWWGVWGLDDIQDSLAAIHTFDFAIMGNHSTQIIQKTLNDFGNDFEVDGDFKPNMCAAINKLDPITYLEALRIRRKTFYIECANKWYRTNRRDNLGRWIYVQTQRHFLPGWLYRADKIRPVLKQILTKRMEKAKRQPL